MAQRGGGKLTGRAAVPPQYAFGDKAEVDRRLEDGFPATESKFTQIRPRSNTASGGGFDAKNGRGQGAHAPTDHNGDMKPGMRGE